MILKTIIFSSYGNLNRHWSHAVLFKMVLAGNSNAKNWNRCGVWNPCVCSTAPLPRRIVLTSVRALPKDSWAAVSKICPECTVWEAECCPTL